jgi:hypothetical protein
LRPVYQSFDAYGVLVGGGKEYSMVLNKPTQLRSGVHPLISGVKRLSSPFSGQLLDFTIPQGIKGQYQVIVGLVPAGKKPSPKNAIPGYLVQVPVVVQ